MFNVSEKSCTIILEYPKYVKDILGKKTDKKDAKWIAELYRKSDVLLVDREITVEQAILLAQFQGYRIKS